MTYSLPASVRGPESPMMSQNSNPYNIKYAYCTNSSCSVYKYTQINVCSPWSKSMSIRVDGPWSVDGPMEIDDPWFPGEPMDVDNHWSKNEPMDVDVDIWSTE